MRASSELRELLEATARVLLRSTVLGILLLLVWFGAFLLAAPAMYNVHGHLFGITPHEMNLIHYGGMAFLKLCVLLFFFFPYVAIRLVLRENRP